MTLETHPDWKQETGFAAWGWAASVADACLSACASAESVRAQALGRFADLVEFARTHSSLYRDLYSHVPDGALTPAQLPLVTRHTLMSRFDEWVTDVAVTRSSLDSFVADPRRIGHAYLGRYAVWKSSGTTGEPGLFVQDAAALATYEALDSTRLGAGGQVAGAAWGLILAGARYVMIAATGGHFAGAASVERLRLLAPAFGAGLRVLSIFEPLPHLVESLNAWQPSFVATYPSVASVLAKEQRAGRLRINPAALWLGGETLSGAHRECMRAAFQCSVLDQYSASECMSIACECACGSLHLNADWVLLEPVDDEYRPVPPGTLSHTALLTNLANRVQPIIRYDLGDRVRIDPDPCECGSPFPTLLIEGRTDDVICARAAGGEEITLLPIALTTVVEEAVDGRAFQLVAAGPERLRLRMARSPDGDTAWNKAAVALRGYLDLQGLANVAIERDEAPVAPHPASGKLQRVIAQR